jgi:hypothetical protein
MTQLLLPFAMSPPPHAPRSGYFGVYWHKRMRKWVVQFSLSRRLIFGGYFRDPHTAAARYNELLELYAPYRSHNVLRV